MTHALDQSILELLNASRDDEDILRLQIRDRAFGFHAQQAVEKLLKALIGGHEVRYEYTHDLWALIERLTLLDEDLPGDTILLES
jgi:HEPN domain-containing protein